MIRRFVCLLAVVIVLLSVVGCAEVVEEPVKNDWVVVHVRDVMGTEEYRVATVQSIDDDRFEAGHVETARAYQEISVGDRVKVNYQSEGFGPSGYYVVLPKEAVESSTVVGE